MNFFIYIIWSPPPIRGILSFYLGIENLGLSLDFSPPFVTRNQDISLSLELTGKPCLTTYRAKSRAYYRNGKFYHLVRTFFFNHFSWFLHLTFTYITLFLFWFCSFWSSWVKESILRSSSDHPCFCLGDRGFWWPNQPSSFVWLLPWTWTHWVCVREDLPRRKN